MPLDTASFAFHPLTPDHWPDLERLFGPRGASGGCWCMWWRLSHADFVRGKGEDNRAALRRIVDSGDPPGLLAYVDNDPAGWVSLSPRAQFPRLAGSRILAPIDDLPVWSIVCFFIQRGYRRQGLMSALIRAAVDYATSRGAAMLEAYPIEQKQGKQTADTFVYTGLASAFRQSGFTEVGRRSPTRPIMRCALGETATSQRG